MGEIVRTATAKDDWWDETPPAPADTDDDYTPEVGTAAVAALRATLDGLRDGVDRLDRDLPYAARALAEGLNGEDLAGIVAAIQDLRRQLGAAEGYAARMIGQDGLLPRTGTLPDGRTFTVLRGADRRAWDHARWQADARRAAVAAAADGHPVVLVDQDTGEALDLFGLLAQVEAVHGAGPPRVSALAALGLQADEYCETSPGMWAVKVTKTTPTPSQ